VVWFISESALIGNGLGLFRLMFPFLRRAEFNRYQARVQDTRLAAEVIGTSARNLQLRLARKHCSMHGTVFAMQAQRWSCTSCSHGVRKVPVVSRTNHPTTNSVEGCMDEGRGGDRTKIRSEGMKWGCLTPWGMMARYPPRAW
jgi:hypothetical protein